MPAINRAVLLPPLLTHSLAMCAGNKSSFKRSLTAPASQQACYVDSRLCGTAAHLTSPPTAFPEGKLISVNHQTGICVLQDETRSFVVLADATGQQPVTRAVRSTLHCVWHRTRSGSLERHLVKVPVCRVRLCWPAWSPRTPWGCGSTAEFQELERFLGISYTAHLLY